MSSSDRPKRDPKQSTPRMLAARMQRAHEDKVPMDLDYEEVTGVIDVALEKSRAITNAGVEKVRELCRKLDSSMPPPKADPA